MLIFQFKVNSEGLFYMIPSRSEFRDKILSFHDGFFAYLHSPNFHWFARTQKSPMFPHRAFVSCELGGIRTPNLLGRNQVHYPVVLRVLCERKTNNYALKFSLVLHDSIFAEIFLLRLISFNIH